MTESLEVFPMTPSPSPSDAIRWLTCATMVAAAAVVAPACQGQVVSPSVHPAPNPSVRSTNDKQSPTALSKEIVAETSSLASTLDSILEGHPCFRRTTLALKVFDLTNNRMLYDRDGDRLLIPASNLKLFTTAAALDRFGTEHTFSTQLHATGQIDSSGTLQGDILLIGGGDAMLTSQQLLQLVDRAVDQWGIQRVAGKVRVDNSRYASPWKGPGWMWDDDPADYNMSISPLMVDFNVATVVTGTTQNGTGENGTAEIRRLVRLDPPSLWPPILPRRADTWRVDRKPFTETVLVDVPEVIATPIRSTLTVHNPGKWVAGMVMAHLANRGIPIEPATDDVSAKRAAPDASSAIGNSAIGNSAGMILTATRTSVTLAETLSHFQHESENAVGEVLLHELAVASGIRQPDWQQGAQVISSWLIESAGLEVGSFRIVDGSGLSRYNLISADSSIRLLRHMAQQDHFNAFYASLKKYELDGQPVVAAKSGGMSGVSTISGYLRTHDNRRLAFSFLANGFIGPSKPLIDLRTPLWQAMYESASEPVSMPK